MEYNHQSVNCIGKELDLMNDVVCFIDCFHDGLDLIEILGYIKQRMLPTFCYDDRVDYTMIPDIHTVKSTPRILSMDDRYLSPYDQHKQ